MDITQAAIDSYFKMFLAPNWHEAYDRTPVVFSELAMTMPSSTLINSYAWMTRLAKLREWIGERQHKNLEAVAMTLKNKKFEDTIDLAREVFEDDQHGLYSYMAADLGAAAKKWPDYLIRDVLEAGTTTLAFDGQDFFSTSHPVDPFDASKGTYSNYQTSKPLTRDNLAAQVNVMRTLVGADGEKLSVNPTHLIVHPDQEDEANRALYAALLAETGAGTGQLVPVGTSSNVIQRFTNLKLVVWADLKLSGTWYLADNSRSVRPLIFQQRIAPVLVPMIAPDSQQVFDKDLFSWGVRARGVAGFSLPFLMRRMDA